MKYWDESKGRYVDPMADTIKASTPGSLGGNILVDCYGYVERSLKNHGIEHVDAEMCAFGC